MFSHWQSFAWLTGGNLVLAAGRELLPLQDWTVVVGDSRIQSSCQSLGERFCPRDIPQFRASNAGLFLSSQSWSAHSEARTAAFLAGGTATFTAREKLWSREALYVLYTYSVHFRICELFSNCRCTVSYFNLPLLGQMSQNAAFLPGCPEWGFSRRQQKSSPTELLLGVLVRGCAEKVLQCVVQ